MSAGPPDDSTAPPGSPPDGAVALPMPRAGGGPLSKRERDYLMLSVLVRVQHLQYADAMTILDAMAALGEDGPDVEFARAVIHYREGRFEAVQDSLRRLDRIEPADATATPRAEERARIRAFMNARAIFALTGELDAAGRASLDYYMRRRPGGAGRASGTKGRKR